MLENFEILKTGKSKQGFCTKVEKKSNAFSVKICEKLRELCVKNYFLTWSSRR